MTKSKKKIKLKKNEIENIKIEYGINEEDISEIRVKEKDEFKSSDLQSFEAKESEE